MEFALTKPTPRLGVLLLIVMVLLLSGCDPYADSYPFLTEAKWECADPKISLEFTKSATGAISERHTLEWNGMVLYIDLNFRANLFVVNPSTSTHYDSRLFTGTWKYQNEYLVLTIEEDFIFDHAYNELVFSKITDD